MNRGSKETILFWIVGFVINPYIWGWDHAVCLTLRLELIVIFELIHIRTLDFQKFMKAMNSHVLLNGCIFSDMRLLLVAVVATINWLQVYLTIIYVNGRQTNYCLVMEFANYRR